MTPDLASLLSRPGPGPHRVTLIVDGRAITTLADLPPLRDRLLFVGLNPSPVSVTSGHYHRGVLGRRFWQRLIEAEILPADTRLDDADDALVAAGHGITDLIKQPTRRDQATDEDLVAGVGPLWQKVAIWRPAAVVFIHKRAANAAAGRPVTERWGALPGVALAGRPCLLLPAPYAPAAEVRAGLAFFRDLAGIIGGLLPTEGGSPTPEGPASAGQPIPRAAPRATRGRSPAGDT